MIIRTSHPPLMKNFRLCIKPTLRQKQAKVSNDNPIVEMWLIRLWPFFRKNKWTAAEIANTWLWKYFPDEKQTFPNDAKGVKYFGQFIRRLGLRFDFRGGLNTGPRENPPKSEFLAHFDFHRVPLNPLLPVRSLFPAKAAPRLWHSKAFKRAQLRPIIYGTQKYRT